MTTLLLTYIRRPVSVSTERFGMSGSEPVINKNKAHRKDKREYKATKYSYLNF